MNLASILHHTRVVNLCKSSPCKQWTRWICASVRKRLLERWRLVGTLSSRESRQPSEGISSRGTDLVINTTSYQYWWINNQLEHTFLITKYEWHVSFNYLITGTKIFTIHWCIKISRTLVTNLQFFKQMTKFLSVFHLCLLGDFGPFL